MELDICTQFKYVEVLDEPMGPRWIYFDLLDGCDGETRAKGRERGDQKETHATRGKQEDKRGQENRGKKKGKVETKKDLKTSLGPPNTNTGGAVVDQ